MAIYTFGIPSFGISQIRSAFNDTLFATTALKVMNPDGSLHQDWGAQAVSLGNHKAGDNVFLELFWQNVDVPGPTPEDPDGGAVSWCFMLVNNGHTGSGQGWLDVFNKAAEAFAGALAEKSVSGVSLQSLESLLGLAGILGLQELLNLLAADCDGLVAASQGFNFTARQLAEMVANSNQTWSTTQQNPGTNSPTGCGANSSYHVNYLIEAPAPRRTFQSLDGTNIFVLGSNGNLWLEQAPFGHVPPSRQQVDGNVLAFQMLDTATVLVLGSDGKLWLEQAPFGHVPPSRQQIDGNVRAFQALDSQTVFVLGSDGKLWLENAPFGNVPPARRQVDGNVRAFQAVGAASGDVFVLGNDGNLWLEQPPFGHVPPARQEVDGNVQAFRALALTGWVWVLGTDGKLWLEQGPFGTVPPQRQQIDGSMQAFQPLDLQHVLVLETDGNLWLEQGPFGHVPPNRQQVDGNVA